MLISDKLCIRCKGKLLCGLSSCPIFNRMRSFREKGLKRDLEAPSPPHYLVSWKGYPQVAVGPNLSFRGIASNPFDMSLEEFVVNRANELRAFQIKGIRNQEEASLSVDPVLFGVKLKSLPRVERLSATGMNAPAESIIPEDGMKVPGRVYSIVDSYDMKAQEGLLRLERYGFDYLVQALSTGNLGLPVQRKMVPTRWAITAVDSALAREHFSRIRGKPQVQNFELYRVNHWDNRFWIVLAPWGWGFEMLERWHDGSVIVDREYGRLKKDYASNITGAYYSARLEVLKQLSGRNRQAAAIVIRQIGKNYIYPVGVWHVREAVKRALDKNPEKFSSTAELETRLMEEVDWPNWKAKSRMWRTLTEQSTLEHFV